MIKTKSGRHPVLLSIFTFCYYTLHGHYLLVSIVSMRLHNWYSELLIVHIFKTHILRFRPNHVYWGNYPMWYCPSGIHFGSLHHLTKVLEYTSCSIPWMAFADPGVGTGGWICDDVRQMTPLSLIINIPWKWSSWSWALMFHLTCTHISQGNYILQLIRAAL